MFTENLKSKALELSRIKNLSEFGLNIDQCNILYSRDLKYGVIYNEKSILVIDTDKKSIISKLSNERNSRILKLKITHKNVITYINASSERTKLCICSMDFIGSSLELNIESDLKDYLYVEKAENSGEDYIFTLNSQGDLEFLSLSKEIQRKKTNLLKEGIRSTFEVNLMEFIEETSNLVIVLSNGTILNYTVSLDPESDIKMSLKTINLEEVRHLESDEFLKDHKLLQKYTYEVSAFCITKFVFAVEEFGMDVIHLDPKLL
jgi:hypothetical protein